MSFKYYLEAKQVGTLYHFTKLKAIEKIIKSGFVLKSSDLKYISFTRDFKLPYSASEFYDHIIRIAINGNNLSNKYKIEPFQYRSSRTKDTEAEERVMKERVNILPYIIQIDIFEDFRQEYEAGYIKNLIDETKKKFPNIKTNLVTKWRPVKWVLNII